MTIVATLEIDNAPIFVLVFTKECCDNKMLDKQRMIQLHSLRIKFRWINKSMETQVALANLIASNFDHGGY